MTQDGNVDGYFKGVKLEEIIDRLLEVVQELKKEKESGQPGEYNRAIQIAITHTETAVLWVKYAKDEKLN